MIILSIINLEEVKELMSIADLEKNYGKALKPKELAKLLAVDCRTIIKYADKWGGVEVSPGHFRFFENKIKEILDAKFNNKAREEEMEGICASQACNTSKTIPRRQQKSTKRSHYMGKRNATETRSRNFTDPYNLMADD
ncbi:MAG: hypothetical protein HQK78_01880 [Desulfobacterales bacterium]|nr:hypothetical protein [Desulfobacterales bacterium]